jgi:hypothetical protein
MKNFVELNVQHLCPVCNCLSAQTFQLRSPFWFWLFTVLVFS